ncbi:MAG TPA: glycosyltransferase [Burkholderiales bacterium]|nr:glycosyltransferase [Burkholderiales bacterium]
MRILMISDVYFPRVNGVSTSIQTFRREFEALGHCTTLIAPVYPAPYRDEPGIIRVPSRYVPLDPEDRMMKRGEIRRLLPRLREERYDLVHVQTPFVAHYLGVEIARELGVPCLETYHTFFEEYLFHYVPFLPARFLRAMARRFSRAQSGQVDALIVPSGAMRDRLAQYGVATPMHVVPTGIPLADFSGGDGWAFRRRYGIPAQRPMLLFVGRMAFEKNIEFLLGALERALHSLPELLLVIAGEGPALGALRRLVNRRSLDEHVLFVGYLDRRHALLDCYRAADAFVFASRTETQGLVLLEAMALGLPVISTAVMGTRDILGPRRGALVPEDDEASFAAAIVGFARDAALRAKLAEEAKDYALEWRSDALARRLVDLYQGIAARHAGGPALTAAASAR